MRAPQMPLLAAFAVGCILAQLGWSLAAGDASALGAPTFRFMMLAGIEILVSAIAFGGGLYAGAKSQELRMGAKACAVAFFSGVLTLTVAGAPYSLVPRLAQGEAQLVILIVAAAVVSTFLGALVGAAFRTR
jgi:hypothetical protein